MTNIVESRTPYQQWIDGDITDLQFVGSVTQDLGEVQDQLDGLQRQEADFKAQLGHVMSVLQAKLGDREYRDTCDMVARRGYKVTFTGPSVRTTVDHKRLTALVDDVIRDVAPALAASIEACYTKTPVAGSQRIQRLKAQE